MKKLLFLMLSLFFSACNSGHSLMSDKPFRADCKLPKEKLDEWNTVDQQNRIRFDVNPALPQATVEPGNAPILTFDVVVASPREILLADKSLPGINFLWSIDRQSGNIRSGSIGELGVKSFDEAVLICKYQSL